MTEPAVAEVLPAASVEAAAVVPPAHPAPALVLEPPGAEVMPPRRTPEGVPAVPTLAPEAWGAYAPPVEAPPVAAVPPNGEAAEPFAGLPYFDDAEQPAGAVQSPVAPAVEAPVSQPYAATVLERVAASIRAGTLTVDGVDATAGEPAALAAVLASLLRQQR